MKVDDLPAGCRLDALVAEKVMEWCHDDDSFWINPKIGMRFEPFQPSTNADAAMEAAERVDLFRSHILTKNEEGKYIVCQPYQVGEWPDYYAGASESAALAICRAVLKAVGVTEVPDAS